MKRAAFLIPITFFFAALLLRIFARHAPVTLHADFAAPIVVVTAWKSYGALFLGTMTLTIGIAAFAYGRVLAHAGAFSLGEVVALSALSLIAAWCVPVLLSSDVYAYAAYGELARLGSDPYAHVRLDPANPLFAAVIWQWGNPPPVCVYGPLFVVIARTVVTLGAGLGIVAQLDGMRALSSLALLACAPLAYAIRSGDRIERLRAAATIGLNPVAIWCAVEGHNDALAIVLTLAGFFALRERAVLGAAAIACAALVKPPAAALLAVASIDRRSRIASAIAFAAVVLLSVPLLTGIAGHLAPAGHYDPQASLAAIVWPIALAISRSGQIASSIAVAITAAIAALLAARGVRSLREHRPEGWLWCALGVWALVPNPYPWYGLWLLALAALVPWSRASTIAMLLALTSWLRYIPDAVGTPGPALTVALAIAASLPLCALIPRQSFAIMSRSL